MFTRSTWSISLENSRWQTCKLIGKTSELQHRVQCVENLRDHSHGFPALNHFSGALSSNIHAWLARPYFTFLLNKETASRFPRFIQVIWLPPGSQPSLPSAPETLSRLDCTGWKSSHPQNIARGRLGASERLQGLPKGPPEEQQSMHTFYKDVNSHVCISGEGFMALRFHCTGQSWLLPSCFPSLDSDNEISVI